MGKNDLIAFLNYFGLHVSNIISFPKGVDVEGRIYDDSGDAVFEWIGPKESPINEQSGGRGHLRTSIDAFILAVINEKVTQVFIEWKFAETYHRKECLQKFGGASGNERLRRYSSVMAQLRGRKEFPLKMNDEDMFGLYDLGYEPLYQLLRMTLLAKMTTPIHIGPNIKIEDYRILHLTHSENNELNYLSEKHLQYLPGLKDCVGKHIHEVWKSKVLSKKESAKFAGGYWDEALSVLGQSNLKSYLESRYCE
jgi:hypothetical protein